MVNPQSGYLALLDEFEDERMGLGKNLLVFHAQGYQFVDVEEAPVVDLLGGDLPEREAEILLGQELVQGVEALGVALFSVESLHVLIDKSLDLRIRLVELPKHALDEHDLIRALPALFGRGQILERVEHPEEFDAVGMPTAKLSPELTEMGPEDLRVRLDIQRVSEIVIMDAQTVLVVLEDDLAVFQTLPVNLSQEGRQNFSPDALVGVVPLDVEVVCVRRGRTVLQNIHEHAVFAVVSHVIGNDVLQPAHAQATQLLGHRVEIFGRAQFSIEAERVNDVVSMHAAGPGLENRRGIKVRDTELVKIGNERLGIREAKSFVKLQPIGGERNSDRSHLIH